ncbi:CMGC/SRPK protein kinase [Fusarium oxysporum f. sp. lycopersici 4287]|uniref:non-specific serine/threonine protein kinase n=1 Tax=Fusarium oxysporum f. sp. lycopersici (strain 4287 / CBS 123668 / FGSC 9935 / NRRL 34936) TaxID=426428 RepID=A0A0J9WI79_FUSO4|nr:CMGC/SRPK protein kinase [Fusarium oxysporum f. sp. lycopersici 4287]KNA98061.1 CMGC/SRPK protein kinase [Fusarium oxysporum f. sp. lycopersici 4287]
MTEISDSPPPTPTAPFKRRLKNFTSPGENPAKYRPGGYHPVNLGDIFNDGQYKVIRKLGEGCFSIVWLAHDLRNSRYVALKILVSDQADQSQEVEILHHLAKIAPSEAPQRTTQILAEFEHKGPNGTHKCLVFEPMGPSVNQMILEFAYREDKFPSEIKYPPQMAKRILRDSLKGLAFLHKNGISHADFQPGNMLFSLNNIDSCDEAALCQEETPDEEYRIERLDGKKDKWAPEYLLTAEPLASHTSIDENLEVKLADMGGAYFLNDPPEEPVVPRALRAPELVLKGEFDKAQDIWSFGCLVFELIAGRHLFYICGPFKDETEPDDEHLLEIQDRLGPLPDELYSHWKTSSRYYTKDRQLYNWALGGVEEGEEPNMPKPSMLSTMEEAFDKEGPEMTEDEAQEVKKLIRWIIQYDPAKRPSAEEILRHPWFAEDSSEKAE